MEPVDQGKSNKIKRYCCSNPNCHRVFSKPKIIKYYVCPSCQTLVDVDSDGFHPPAHETTMPKRKQVRRLKESNQEVVPEPQVVELTSSAQAPIIDELVPVEKPEVEEDPETVMPAQTEEIQLPDNISNLESQDASKEQTQSSDFKCSYYFGYLSERNKSDGVPETCFVCSKSVECMLQEYNKSKDSVEEIKKWYSL